MEKKIRKIYYNFEKEEIWLNEMAANGWSLKNYTYATYTFEKTEKNEYIYQIELLQHSKRNKKSKDYIVLLEESGLKCIASYGRWIYLQRKISDEVVDLYTDIPSKIDFYKKIIRFWNWVAIIELILGAYCLIECLYPYVTNQIAKFPVFYVLVSLMLWGFAVHFILLSVPLKCRIKSLLGDD